MPDEGHAFWERTANRYDLSMALLGGPLGPMCERVVRDVTGCDRVLEVAAGTGLVTRVLAPAVGQLVATDYSPAMVGKLRERTEAEGLGNVSVEVLDVFELDDREGFDAIVAANVTYCHAQTLLSRAVSGVMGLVGFPGQRRLTLASLEALAIAHGLEIESQELLPGLLPIGYVAARRTLDK